MKPVEHLGLTPTTSRFLHRECMDCWHRGFAVHRTWPRQASDGPAWLGRRSAALVRVAHPWELIAAPDFGSGQSGPVPSPHAFTQPLDTVVDLHTDVGSGLPKALRDLRPIIAVVESELQELLAVSAEVL